MRKTKYLISALLLAVIMLLSLFSCGAKGQRVVSLNSQTGIYVKNNSKAVSLNGEVISVYNTYSKDITLEFEAYHVDGDYRNKIIVNDAYEFALDEQRDGHSGFVKYSIPLLGLNIIDGSMKVKFVAGADHTGIGLDTYYVRNVVIKVGTEEIWSDNYDRDNYRNEKLGLGEQELPTPDGKQWSFNWTAYGTMAVLDFGVSMEGQCVVAYDPSVLGAPEGTPYQIFNAIGYEFVPADETSGTLKLISTDMYGDEITQEFKYYDLTDNSCYFEFGEDSFVAQDVDGLLTEVTVDMSGGVMQ